MEHQADCNWETAFCEYKGTHFYCPHLEHACSCRKEDKIMEDVFRKVYTPITDEQKDQVQKIKETAEKLLATFPVSDDRSEKSRCAALAKTKLEEAVMWAVKGATAV